MDDTIFQILTALLTGVIAGMVIILLLHRRKGENTPSAPPDQNIIALLDEVRKLPVRVLHTVQGSISPKKGKMGELIVYTRLLAEYDRLIPLGQPVDFIGVRNHRGIDFIEVKTGGSGLTKEEAEIKRLIEEGKVRFVLQRVNSEVYRQKRLDEL